MRISHGGKMRILNDKSADAARLRAAAKVFRREVASGLEVKLDLFLEDRENAPDLRMLARLIERLVDWHLECVETAEEGVEGARAALVAPRVERDEACEVLRGVLSELRDLSRWISEHRPGCALVDDRLEVPEDPHGLLRYTDLVLDWLRRDGLPEMPLVTFEPEKLIGQLQPTADALRGALEEIELKEPEVGPAVERRERAVAEFEGDCGAGIRALAWLGLLAGEDGVALMVPAKLRRS